MIGLFSFFGAIVHQWKALRQKFFVALSEALPVLKKMRFEPFDTFRRDPDEVLRCRVQRHSLPKHFRVVKGTMNQNLTKKLFLSTVNMQNHNSYTKGHF